MEGQLTCVSLNIHTTTVCTLKCAKCGWSFPRFGSPVQADIDKTITALEKLFKVYDYIQEIRFGGAEAFLYPDIQKLMEALAKYKAQFEYAIVITNGTYIPKASILETIMNLQYPMVVRIDDYGSLSKKYDELLSVLQAYDIKVDERVYTGEEQAFGGWVYYGDYTDKHYTDEQLKNVFCNCRLPDDGAILFDDMLTNCCYATAGQLLGKVLMKEREIVNLTGNQSIEEMRDAVKSWRDEPFEACKYCNGFDPENSSRIPAAEQLSD